MDQRTSHRRARQSRASKNGPPAAPDPQRPRGGRPDLQQILGRFSDALSMISVVQRSLSSQEFTGIGDEEVALRHALDALKSVYNALDEAAALILSDDGTSLAVTLEDDYK